MTHPPANPASEVKLSPAMRSFLIGASELSDTYVDGEGPEATAQHAERHGLAYISAWKGYWQVTLSEDGRQLRAHLLAPTCNDSVQVVGAGQEEMNDG